MWHELKEYIYRIVKPKDEDELVSGIFLFLDMYNVDISKCKKGHLRKVVPKVIEMNGGPTGY